MTDDLLRRDVRMLGDMLGAIISRLAGPAALELVEQIRLLARERRGGSREAERQLAERIAALRPRPGPHGRPGVQHLFRSGQHRRRPAAGARAARSARPSSIRSRLPKRWRPAIAELKRGRLFGRGGAAGPRPAVGRAGLYRPSQRSQAAFDPGQAAADAARPGRTRSRRSACPANAGAPRPACRPSWPCCGRPSSCARPADRAGRGRARAVDHAAGVGSRAAGLSVAASGRWPSTIRATRSRCRSSCSSAPGWGATATAIRT